MSHKEMSLKKVLLVDDSSVALMMEEMILKQRTAYKIITARDGCEAVEKARVERPDVIVMDVCMPRMDGFEACRELRRDQGTKQIPIILVTTRGEEEHVEAGFTSGCSDYLTKPVNSTELISMLRSYVGE